MRRRAALGQGLRSGKTTSHNLAAGGMGGRQAPGAEVQTSFRWEGRAHKGELQSDPPCCGPIQESSERGTQKRLRPSTKSSILAEAKDSALAGNHNAENKVAREPCQLSAPGISVKEAADVVVRYLTPFYKEGRFISKVGEWAWGVWVNAGSLGWQGVYTPE